MTYLYGHQSEEIRALQKALAALGLYKSTIDGKFVDLTKAAVIEAQQLYALEPADGVVDARLLLELGITAPPKPHLTPNPVVQAIGGFAFRLLLNQLTKGLFPMDSTTVDVKSAWLSSKNWAAGIAILTNIAALFHIVIPPDLAPTVVAVVDSVTALYILVKNTWFTSSITTASAKNK